MFLDTTVYKGTRFKDQSILDVKTHFKPTETFQYTHFTSCHPPSVKNGFVKGEALRILRTNSSKDTFEENISKFKRHLRDRGYPRNLVEKLLSEIKFTRRGSVLKGNNKTQKDILPFVTQYRPSVSNLKQALLKKWHLIQNQPLLRQIFKEPPIISYRKGKSLRDLLVRATIKGSIHVFTQEGNQCGLSLLAFLILERSACESNYKRFYTCFHTGRESVWFVTPCVPYRKYEFMSE